MKKILLLTIGFFIVSISSLFAQDYQSYETIDLKELAEYNLLPVIDQPGFEVTAVTNCSMTHNGTHYSLSNVDSFIPEDYITSSATIYTIDLEMDVFYKYYSYGQYGQTEKYGSVMGYGKTLTIENLIVELNLPLSSICQNGSSFTLSGGSPSGGTYYINGNSVTSFNPAYYSGDVTVSYVYSGETATDAINVKTITTASLAAFSSIYVDDDEFTLTGGAPTGGTYDVNGSTATSFNPANYGAGNHTITYTYYENGCSSSESQNLEVLPLMPSPIDPVEFRICQNEEPQALVSNLNGGTIYVDGNELSNGIFDPSAYSVGYHSGVYKKQNYEDESFQVIVNAVTLLTFNFLPEKCTNEGTISLNSYVSPTGGTFSGNGVSGTTFTPSSSIVGDNTITYTYTNSSGCTSSASQTVTVHAITQASLSSFSDICQNGSAFILSGGTPSGGKYYVDDVYKTSFDPANYSTGDHTIKYEYTNGNGCVTSAEQTITVLSVSSLTFNALPSKCSNEESISLNAYVLPIGGSFSGNGVNGTSFTPSSSIVGDNIITYAYTNSSGCTSTASQTATVHAITQASLPSFSDICQNGNAFTISGGSPSGGYYTVNDVVQTVFDPSAYSPGDHKIKYYYTNSNGCVTSAEQTISILSVPSLTFNALPSKCSNEESISLNSYVSPTGGSFSGNGVNGTSFTPSSSIVGDNIITYAYTNSSGCTSTASQTATVHAITQASLPSFSNICQNGNAFTISGGSPSGGYYTVNDVEQTVFDPSAYSPGDHKIKYYYTNSNGCVTSAEQTITILSVPSLTFNALPSKCSNEESISLNSYVSPTGGSFSGNGVNGTSFTPSSSIVGDNTITYTYTNSSGCTSTVSQNIVVHDVMQVSLSPPADVYSNEPTFSFTGGSPYSANAYYTFNGVQMGELTPEDYNPGNYILQYHYPNANGCWSVAQQTLTISTSIYIPDPNFKQALIENTAINTDGNTEISQREAAAFTGILDMSYKNIADLTGIEYFTNLTIFSCSGNQLSNLDMSQNTALTILHCHNNQLSSLDLSRNTALTNLQCYSNQLSSLDVSQSAALTYLDCYNNQLSSLDVSQSTALTDLICYDNQLSSLDVSQNTVLTRFNCENNQLSSLDVSANTSIKTLSCGNNQLSSLDLSKNIALTNLYCYGNSLSSLDLTNNTALEYLTCSYNHLGSLDLSENTALKRLYCHVNRLSSLDISKNTSLTRLFCDNNKFPFSALKQIKDDFSTLTYASDSTIFSEQTGDYGFELDYSTEVSVGGNETSFTWYDDSNNEVDESTVKGTSGVFQFLQPGIYHCKMTNASFSGLELQTKTITINQTILEIPDPNFKQALVENTEINTDGDTEISQSEAAAFTGILDMSYKNIADLTGIEYFTNLTIFSCSGNQLSNLDMSQNTALTILHCHNNQLSSLDVSQNTALRVLYCYSNQLSSLDLSQNTALTNLQCYSNQLSSLDVSQSTALTYLDCYNNQLSSLNVSQSTALTDLTCYDNQLSSLDVSQNTVLTRFNCENNQLSSLDVSANTSIKALSCGNNQLSSLDLSKNIALTNLYCYGNNLSSLDLTNNTALEYLTCSYNHLGSLDLSENTALKHLYCHVNRLSSLDVSNTSLTRLFCDNNKFPFSALKQIKDDFSTLTYASDSTIFSALEGNSGLEVDYSAEVSVDGNTTLFTWYNDSGNPVDDSAVKEQTTPGVFRFLQRGIYHCKMTNTSFSGLELQTETLTINTTELTFPDENFRLALIGNDEIDTNNDDVIWLSEATAFTETLNVSSENISDLTGIEYFINITKLSCGSNQLSSLDLSQNTALTNLFCSNNRLSSLDVSNNKALVYLYCEANQLSSLDVSANTSLEYLYCRDNQLSGLDVSNNTDLTRLYCYENQLSNLDVSQNTSLAYLSCRNNQLNSLDISNNTDLTYLSCSDNRLRSLDVSQNIVLSNVQINNNKFPFSALQVIKDHFPSLTYTSDSTIFSVQEGNYGFEVDYSEEVSIDGNTTVFTWYDNSGNPVDESAVKEQATSGVFQFLQAGIYHCKMSNATFPEAELKTETLTIHQPRIINIPDDNFKEALVSDSKINTYDDGEISESEATAYSGALTLWDKNILDLTGIEYFTGITSLNCSANQLNSLDLSQNTSLTDLICFSNNLSSLNLSQNSDLIHLDCSFNQLSSLNVSQNTALVHLSCYNNQLISLVVGGNTALTDVICYNNQLSSLDVSQNTDLRYLNCENNQLKNLDVSANIALVTLSCATNHLTNLDVSQNTILENLNCSQNQLKSLNLAQNKDLDYLICSYNQLSSLDVSHNTNLHYLFCSYNQLSSLDISQNTVLNRIYCQGNRLSSLDVSRNTDISSLFCDNNKFPFSALGQIKDQYSALTYTSDSTIFSVQEGNLFFETDYSAEAFIHGNTTSFIWYDQEQNPVDESVVKEQTTSGIFQFLQPGTYYCKMTNATFPNAELQTETITINADDGDGINFANSSVKTKVNNVLEMNNEAPEASFSIYPNPVVDEVNIRFTDSSLKTISLYNLTGKVLMQTEAFDTKTMNLSDLPAGMYILKIQTEVKMLHFKIIKK